MVICQKVNAKLHKLKSRPFRLNSPLFSQQTKLLKQNWTSWLYGLIVLTTLCFTSLSFKLDCLPLLARITFQSIVFLVCKNKFLRKFRISITCWNLRAISVEIYSQLCCTKDFFKDEHKSSDQKAPNPIVPKMTKLILLSWFPLITLKGYDRDVSWANYFRKTGGRPKSEAPK